MATTAVTQDQFDKGLQSLLDAEAKRDAAVTQALQDFAAKLANPAGVDLSAEFAKITTLQSNAAALTQSATSADPGPTSIPTAPVTTPPAVPTA